MGGREGVTNDGIARGVPLQRPSCSLSMTSVTTSIDRYACCSSTQQLVSVVDGLVGGTRKREARD